MKKSLNLNLKDARDQCVEFLVNALTSPIYQGIYSIYIDAAEHSPENVLKGFQMRLKKIKEWSGVTIEQEYARVSASTKGSKYIEDLITSIFVSNAKILSCATGGGKIEINVPNALKFIHYVYLETARRFYEDPKTFQGTVRGCVGNSSQEHKRQKALTQALQMIADSITYTIKSLTPVDEILSHINETLKGGSKSGSESEGSSGSESETESDSDSEIIGKEDLNEMLEPDVINVDNDINAVATAPVGQEEKISFMNRVFDSSPTGLPATDNIKEVRVSVPQQKGGKFFNDAADY